METGRSAEHPHISRPDGDAHQAQAGSGAIVLREYQARGVEDIRQAYRSGLRAPLYVLPTGGGKTVIFSHISGIVSARKKRVLVLVHRIELLRQTSAALTKNRIQHGLISPKYTPNPFRSVQIGSVQTVARRLNLIGHYDLIVIDECHHATASTWQSILKAYPAAHVLGVTATPVRGDGVGLGKEAGGIFDSLIEGPPVTELIENGYLVKPIVFAPAQRLDLSGLHTRMGDYVKEEVEARVDKPTITGNAVDHYIRLAKGLPAVAFCVSVKHAEHVAEEFRSRGIRAQSVDGSMDDERRKAIIRGLETGEVEVLTSCDLISEGTDIPAIGAAILLRPTKSMGLYIQQVGRALRPFAGKSQAVILDHVGNVLMHGMPDESREWTLSGELKRRRKSESQVENINVRQCEKCYAVYQKAQACPHCGYQKPEASRAPREVQGELSHVSADQIRRQKRQEVGRARTLADLEALAAARGYRKGWAYHVWTSRNGTGKSMKDAHNQPNEVGKKI